MLFVDIMSPTDHSLALSRPMTSSTDSNTDSSALHSGRHVLSVSELNRKAKQLLEIHLPLMWVEGEISNFSKPSSGHWYFTLKDQNAQVRCAMFRGRNGLIKFTPKAGDQVQVRARVSLYEGRGDYQLIAEHMEEAGFGILQKRYQELKQKLEDEGLFSETHKKALPCAPNHLAVITSATGAALHDVLSVLKRRFPSLPVTLLPCIVQGDGSSQQLIEAVKLADADKRFDVIIVCRGGGPIEDLWSFNSEGLARSIHAAKTPIVSAVGHEIDFTIADFAADVRAPTPSAAAELISPNAPELLQALKEMERQLESRINSFLVQSQQQLHHTRQRLRNPKQQLQNWAQRLDILEIKLSATQQSGHALRSSLIDKLRSRLAAQNPEIAVKRNQQTIADINHRLAIAMQHKLDAQYFALSKAGGMLNIMSPLNTLKRGYAIAKDSNGAILREAKDTQKGDSLQILLGKGEISVIVASTKA